MITEVLAALWTMTNTSVLFDIVMSFVIAVILLKELEKNLHSSMKIQARVKDLELKHQNVSFHFKICTNGISVICRS